MKTALDTASKLAQWLMLFWSEYWQHPTNEYAIARLTWHPTDVTRVIVTLRNEELWGLRLEPVAPGALLPRTPPREFSRGEQRIGLRFHNTIWDSWVNPADKPFTSALGRLRLSSMGWDAGDPYIIWMKDAEGYGWRLHVRCLPKIVTATTVL